MTEPNFKQWAEYIINADQSEAAIALKQAYNQGYHLGKLEGYEDGKENGWWKDYDAFVELEKDPK